MIQRVFTAKVRSILNDNQGRRWHPAQRAGPALDTARLALAPAGSDRVFRRPAERLFRDYTVALYTDVSGSMEGEKLQAAASAAHALHVGLERAGCTVTSHGFADRCGEFTEVSRRDVRQFYEALATAGKVLGGGTQDYLAIREAEQRMARVQGGKIVVILSDGESGSLAQLQAQLVEARRKGITVLALGVAPSRPMAEVYGRRWALDLDEVGQVYDQLARLLVAQYRRG